MLRRMDKNRRSGKRAFTLVELIVVLVILAIIAAMLIPALTGYIRKGKKAKYIQRADEARIAAQAVFMEFYALEDLNQVESLGGDNSRTATNIEWYKGRFQDYGDKVLQLMGTERGSAEEPYVLVIGVGHDGDARLTDAQHTTAYYVAYMETRTSPAIFYINGEWTYRWPKDSDVGLIRQDSYSGMGRNTMHAGGLEFPLRFYVICSGTGNNDFWIGANTLGTLQGNSQRSNGSYLSGVRY